MVDIKKYRIIQIFQENPMSKTMRMEPLEGRRFDFKPGQFVMLHLLDASSNTANLKRAYTISCSPTAGNYLEVTFKIQGVFTNELAKMREGNLLGVEGPYGSFVLDESIKDDLVFIAGGLGITPFRCMLNYIVKKNLPNQVIVFYSSRFYENFVSIKDLEELKERKSNLRYILTLTGDAVPENWGGLRGRIDEKMLKENLNSFDRKVFYICGPPQMVKEIVEILSRNGVEKDKIKSEGWG